MEILDNFIVHGAPRRTVHHRVVRLFQIVRFIKKSSCLFVHAHYPQSLISKRMREVGVCDFVIVTMPERVIDWKSFEEKSNLRNCFENELNLNFHLKLIWFRTISDRDNIDVSVVAIPAHHSLTCTKNIKIIKNILRFSNNYYPKLLKCVNIPNFLKINKLFLLTLYRIKRAHAELSV